MTLSVNKKGQTIFIEFALALLIFILALLFYYKYIPPETQTTDLATLGEEAILVSDSLMSTGYPMGWTPETVSRIGLANTGNRVNTTKISFLASMDYDHSLFLMGTQFDYGFYFEDRYGNRIILNNITNNQIGKKNTNLTELPSNPDVIALVRIERLIIMNNDIVKMVITVWDE